MRKRIFPRIVWFVLLNGVIFILLVAMQFTRGGNFSQRIDNMLISGRYAADTAELSGRRALDGGARVLFGGLEFRLAAAEYITTMDSGAVFGLPDGVTISFAALDSEELQISGIFSDSVSAVEIPFRTQRSSLTRDHDDDLLSVLYSGGRYQFNRPLHNRESGKYSLLLTTLPISYRQVNDEAEFNPADFIIPQAETALEFSDALSRWINYNFALWGQMGLQTDEDTVIAWCGEAVRQGVYRSAVSVVPVSFSSDPQRSWASAVYQFDRRIGVWERAVRAMGDVERERFNHISLLLGVKERSVFTENHLIDFLAVRGYHALVDSFLAFAREIDPSVITLETAPGILESAVDMYKWYPDADNPFGHLAEQVSLLTAEGIHRAGDQVFVFADGIADMEYNLRLGLAIHEWGEQRGNTLWAGMGRSLVLSVVERGDSDGSIPVSVTINALGEFIPSSQRISAARAYRLLDNSVYLPHARPTGANGIWAWTASPAVNIAQSANQMDIAIQFPVGETHYVMLRNVRPFSLLRIYDMNWRRAVDFESYYNSSGWYYFEQEQALVIKVSHRSSIEHIRIYFTAPQSDPPSPPSSAEPED